MCRGSRIFCLGSRGRASGHQISTVPNLELQSSRTRRSIFAKVDLWSPQCLICQIEPKSPTSGPVYRRDYISRREITGFARRYFSTIVGSLLAAFSIAGIYLVRTPPVYTAHAELLIDPKLPQPVRESSGDNGYQLDGPQVDSQMAVLRSHVLAGFVVDSLSLVHDPEFGPSPPSALSSLYRSIFGTEATPSPLSDQELKLIAEQR